MKTILIVDDQKTVLLTLEAILKKNGYVVIACTNSIDAFEQVSREKLDLIITDAIMPMGVNGFNLISSIRSSATLNNKVPIIMLTGRRETSDVERAVLAGANDYMIKPIDPDVLIEKVKKLLANNTDPTEDFIHANINKPATVQLKINLVSTSEISLIFTANTPFSAGQIYKINCDFFNDLELGSISIRVNECLLIVRASGDSTDGGGVSVTTSSGGSTAGSPATEYRISANYVGLSEKELSILRTWIRQKLLADKKT